jgi:hypothetical protein
MLLSRGKIIEEMVRMLSGWKHTGFNVFCGNRISPTDDTAMENLARYIIRASFSQERMQYLDQGGKVVYTSKNGKSSKIFPALKWLADMCSHIPNRGEQLVRYYGHYSNVSRGKRLKDGLDDAVPCILESQGDQKTFRRNWARLIQKIYEVDPLVCPRPVMSCEFVEQSKDVRLPCGSSAALKTRPPIHLPYPIASLSPCFSIHNIP